MAWPKGTPRPPGAGRRAGTPNKRTQIMAAVRLDAMKQIAAGTVSELPHEFSVKCMRLYDRMAQAILSNIHATPEELATAFGYLETARVFARDAMAFYAPRLIGVKSGVELTRPVEINILRFSDRAPVELPPALKQIDHEPLHEAGDEFDEPAPRRPPPVGKNGGS